MKRRWALIVPLLCAAVAVVVLLAAGSQSLAVRTFALGAPDEYGVAVLRPGSRLCEGPVSATGATGSVRIWGGSTSGLATMAVEVRGPQARRTLATGTLETVPGLFPLTVALDRRVPGGRPITICLIERAGEFSLAGYPTVNPAVVMTGPLRGPQPSPEAGHQFSLVLLSRPARSILSTLSTAFSRASLWRPSWVGSWIFWVLIIGILGAFGLGAIAVTLASAADEGAGRETGDEASRGEPQVTDDVHDVCAERTV